MKKHLFGLSYSKNIWQNLKHFYFLWSFSLSTNHEIVRCDTLSTISHIDANNPVKSESSLFRRRHRKDISMTEYVQLKLRDLSKKPWEEILKSPLVRNYLLLLGLLLLVLIVFFTYAVYKQYQHLRKNHIYSEIQY